MAVAVALSPLPGSRTTAVYVPSTVLLTCPNEYDPLPEPSVRML